MWPDRGCIRKHVFKSGNESEDIKNADAEGRPENLCSNLENLIELFNNIWQLHHKISYLYDMKGYNQKIYSDNYLARESWQVKKTQKTTTIKKTTITRHILQHHYCSTTL